MLADANTASLQVVKLHSGWADKPEQRNFGTHFWAGACILFHSFWVIKTTFRKR